MSDFWSNLTTPHAGSWFGLPDFGLTELLTNQTTGQQGSDIVPNTNTNYPTYDQLMSGQSTTPSWNPTMNSALNPALNPQQFQSAVGAGYNPQTSYITINGETKKGADWQKEGKVNDKGQIIPPGGGGGGGGGGGNSELQNRLNGIMQRLQLMRGEGERLRNAAKGVRDEVWGNIDTQYGGLANAAKQKRQSSLDALAETDRGVVRDYATGQGTLNKAAEGSELKNRALARALGFGNGSYYQNMQRENTSNLFDKTAGLTNERSGKLADIKTKVGETNTWFDQKSLEIDQEAKSLKAQADREYQDNVSKSTLAEQMYGIDAADAAAQAEYDYRNKLNSIDSYVNNKQGILDAIASVSGARKSEVNAYQPIDAKLQARLSNSGDLTEASNPNFDTISNPVETGTLSGLNKMFKGLVQNPLQDYLYAGLSDARRFLPTGAFNS